MATSERAASTPAREPARNAAPLIHESAHRHVSGEALYVDDLPLPRGCLHGWIVTSPHPHARIVRRDATRGPRGSGRPRGAASRRTSRGTTTSARSSTTSRSWRSPRSSPWDRPWPSSPRNPWRSRARRRPWWWWSTSRCRRSSASRRESARGRSSPSRTRSGAGTRSRRSRPHPSGSRGEVRNGAQEHFYLETQTALALPEEGGTIRLISSTQHPSEVQAKVGEVLGWPLRPRGGRDAAHGRRVRRQGDPGRALRLPGRAGGGADPAPGEGVAQPRSGHGADGKAPPVPHALRGRLLRGRAPAGAGGRHVRRRRVGERSLPLHPRPWALPPGQRLLPLRRALHGARGPDAPALQHGLPRLRWAAGHAGHRGDPQPRRGPPGTGSGGDPAPELLRRRGAQHHALRSAARAQPAADGRGAAPDADRGRRAAGAGGGLQPGFAVGEARAGVHAGEVRHLLHRQLPEPGRRAGADLHGRQRAAEPRRHRDGAGPAHQDAGGLRPGAGCSAGAGAGDDDRHGQGAQHLGDGRLERLGPERHGGARRLREAARAPGAGGGAAPGAGPRRGTAASSSATAGSDIPPPRGRSASGRSPRRPTSRSSRSRRRATTARRTSTTTA